MSGLSSLRVFAPFHGAAARKMFFAPWFPPLPTMIFCPSAPSFFAARKSRSYLHASCWALHGVSSLGGPHHHHWGVQTVEACAVRIFPFMSAPALRESYTSFPPWRAAEVSCPFMRFNLTDVPPPPFSPASFSCCRFLSLGCR